MRRIPSRRILPRREPLPLTRIEELVAFGFLAGLLASLLAAIYWAPWSLAVIALVMVVSAILTARHYHRLRRLAESRPGESLCQFARSFDCRLIDTWIIRAVYEEVRFHIDELCPIRATDRLWKEFDIDDEVLDEIISQVAHRTGRSLVHCEENPYFGRVVTVADLVHFFMNQKTLKPEGFPDF